MTYFLVFNDNRIGLPLHDLVEIGRIGISPFRHPSFGKLFLEILTEALGDFPNYREINIGDFVICHSISSAFTIREVMLTRRRDFAIRNFGEEDAICVSPFLFVRLVGLLGISLL